LSLFEYNVNQETYEIFGVKIGGEPGVTPTVMIGSMFYRGQKLVLDHHTGDFCKLEAEKIIKHMEEESDKTGLPVMVDVIAENKIAISKYIDFLTSISDMPILLDLLSDEAIIGTLQNLFENGLNERFILNSLNKHTKNEVYKKIKQVKCKSAVLLLYETSSILSSNKSELLEYLLIKTRMAGIEKPLIDTAVLDISTLGLSSKAIYCIKNQFGYPCGCGPHNALKTWKNLNNKFSNSVIPLTSVISALPVTLGADFILYGPAENAGIIFPSIALINTSYSQLAYERGIKPIKSHPRYKIG
jgi:tetrahydromethanopterin S-methyltransferase subunit H